FFFSSRRRHTRFSRDWSSDVCSSDLTITLKNTVYLQSKNGNMQPEAVSKEECIHGEVLMWLTKKHVSWLTSKQTEEIMLLTEQRSEERRVGKECRSRGAWDQ